MKSGKRLILAVLLVGTGQVGASVVMLSGASQMEDTYLRGDNSQGGTVPANNYGASTLLLSGRLPDNASQNLANTLMRFDMTSLSGQTVTNAVLRLYNTNHANQTADATVNVYEVASANGGWVEGGGNGTVVTGTSDWRFKIQNTGAWAGGQNGCGVAGTDYINTLIGQATVVDGLAGDVEFTLDARVIQKWIDHPEQNYGIILTSPGAAEGAMAYFSSSEAASNGPQLVLQTIPEPSPFGLVASIGGVLVFIRHRMMM